MRITLIHSFALLFGLWICISAKGQNAGEVICASQVRSFQSTDSIISQLQTTYDVLIYSTRIGKNDIRDQYYLLGKSKNKWSKIVYRYKHNYQIIGGPSPIIFETTPVCKDVGDSILNFFRNQNFCSIASINDGCAYEGKPVCGNGSKPYYVLGIMTPTTIIEKSYNDPKYFEEKCCPGSTDRQIFIKCETALTSITHDPNQR